MFPFELTRPWVLLVLVPMALAVAYYFRRSLSDFPRSQRMVSMAVRLAMLLLLVLALADLTLLRETDQQFVIVLSDQSLSIGDEGSTKAQEFLRQVFFIRRLGAIQRVDFIPKSRSSWSCFGTHQHLARQSRRSSTSQVIMHGLGRRKSLTFG